MDAILDIRNTFQNIGLSTYLIVAIASFVILKRKFTSKNNYKLAPKASGGHFLFGHVAEMLKKPHFLFESLRKKHGNVFSIGFAGNYAVVLTNWASTKELLKMEGLSQRASELVTISDDFDTLSQVNGKSWESRRKFAINVLRNLNLQNRTEELITFEVSRVLNSVDKLDISKDVDFRKLLSTATNNVGLSMVCGKSYEAGHPMSDFVLEFNLSIMHIVKLRPIANYLGFSSSIFSLFSSTFGKSVNIMNKMADFIRKEVDEHSLTLDAQNPRDLIDYAIIEMAKTNENKKYTKVNEVIGDSLVMLLGGTDTVRISSEWAFLLLAQYPDMQDRIIKEILAIYGDRKPTWEQHSRLPFTEAFIAESQRFKTILPILIPRKSPRDIKIQGYDVPKGSYILPSLHCIHMDEAIYKNPKEFNPTRFLSEDGTKMVIPEHFVAFSSGNRNCLGDKVAKMELFLILTGILQKYRVVPPQNGINLDETMVVLLLPTYPYIRLQKRF